MKLPIVATKAHLGKSLELDPSRETMTVLGPEGESLGTATWGSVIDYIRSTGEQPRTSEARTQPRVTLTAKIRYTAPNGTQVESRATGVGGGGLFIESNKPLVMGTELTISFALPDRPAEWLHAKGIVAWVCPKPDQYTFFPGMGIRFTNLSPETGARVLEFVNSLKRP